jgi:uncharacterized membrane protein YdjX (TVP38/TMEM64 family)
VGRRIFTWLSDREHLDYYTRRISHDTPFSTVALFQLALPSEVPGYVLGTVGYPFIRYIAVQAVLELPWAIGAVYLGDSFIEGRYGIFMALGAAGLIAIAIAARRFQREMGERRG